MGFNDQFREKYRASLNAARGNDEAGVIAGLQSVVDLLEEQYNKRNADSIVIKAKLDSWCDAFRKYVQIVKKNGLGDRRVQKLFGLIVDDSAPSLSDIVNGGAQVPVEPAPAQRAGGIDMAGLEPVAPVEEAPATPAPAVVVPPVEGVIPVEEAPAEAVPVEEIPAEVIPVEETPAEAVPAEEAPADAVATFDPESLAGFIGQAHIVKALKKEIAIARKEGRKHLDNILLFGNPGLGKSTLMKLIAKELGVRFELLDCSQFRNSQQSLKALQNFFMRVAREDEPVVIALDEVHMLTDELQSSLLTLLNDRVYVSPLDASGQNKRIPIEEFTFIAATTDDDKVLDTIKNRCLRLKFQMVDYTHDELKQIYRNKIAAKGMTADDDAIETCIPRSRGAIRYVNSIVDGLNTALYDDEGERISNHVDMDVALRYFEEKGIDPIGLEKKDLEILRVIEEDTTGAISADTLSARVGMDTKKYLSEHERYLIKIGFIAVSGRGRSLTEKAIKYLQGDKKDGEE